MRKPTEGSLAREAVKRVGLHRTASQRNVVDQRRWEFVSLFTVVESGSVVGTLLFPSFLRSFIRFSSASCHGDGCLCVFRGMLVG